MFGPTKSLKINTKVLVYHPQSQQITEWFSYLESAAQVETNVDLIGFPSQIQSLSLSLSLSLSICFSLYICVFFSVFYVFLIYMLFV